MSLYDYVRFDGVVYRTSDLGGDLQFYDIVKDDNRGVYRIYKHKDNNFKLEDATQLNEFSEDFEFGHVVTVVDRDLPKLDVTFFIEIVDGVVYNLTRDVSVYDECTEHTRCIQHKELVNIQYKELKSND